MGKNHFLRAKKLDLEKIIDQREAYNSCHHNIKKGHSGRAYIIIIITTTTTTTTTTTKIKKLRAIIRILYDIYVYGV